MVVTGEKPESEMEESVFDPTFGGELPAVIGGGEESVFDPTFGGTKPLPGTPTNTPGTKPSTTKPATTTKPRLTSSGITASTETTDPLYAGEMGDFNLFTTLEDILADQSDKKDSAKSKVRTKMATGGHIDEFNVDALLRLLRS